MSGRELDPDGTDSYHPEHPWEQAGHPLYLPANARTAFNWPPEPAQPHGPHEAQQWRRLPARITPPDTALTFGPGHTYGQGTTTGPVTFGDKVRARLRRQ